MSRLPTCGPPGSNMVVGIVGGAIGAVLAVLAGVALFPDRIAPLAYLAIGVIGSGAAPVRVAQDVVAAAHSGDFEAVALQCSDDSGARD